MLRHLQPDLRIGLREWGERAAVDFHGCAGETCAGNGHDRSAGDRPLRGRDAVDARLLRECRGAENSQCQRSSNSGRGEKAIRS